LLPALIAAIGFIDIADKSLDSFDVLQVSFDSGNKVLAELNKGCLFIVRGCQLFNIILRKMMIVVITHLLTRYWLSLGLISL